LHYRKNNLRLDPILEKKYVLQHLGVDNTNYNHLFLQILSLTLKVRSCVAV